MLSPCRTTSRSSYRSLVAAARTQYTPLAQARPNYDSNLSPSCTASTSRSCLSSTYHSSSIRPKDDTRATKALDFDSIAPAVNTPLTPKAAQTVEEAQAWLRDAFPELPLPDDIAMMMITHESWDHGMLSGHNRRLSFLGRRAMKFYISLFLSKHSPNGEMLDSAKVNELLHTSKLGDSVGQVLKLAEVMRWTPAINGGQKGPRETGLYKIRGLTVEALVGAIYHQHGAQAARAFFSARILPNLGTFSEKEALTLKGAIEGEVEAGLAVLRTLDGGSSATVPFQDAKAHSATSSTETEDLLSKSLSDKRESRPASPLTGTRRRTLSKADLSLEEEIGGVRPASDRQTIA